MDNRLHFKGRIGQIALDNQQLQKKYQSEDSGGDSPNTPQSSQQKAKKDYQTDDSDAGTPIHASKKNSPVPQKHSRFRNNGKQNEQQVQTNVFKQTGRQSLGNLHANSDSETLRLANQAKKSDKLVNHPFRHLIFGPKVDEAVFQKHLSIIQSGLIYSKNCLKGPSEQFIQQKQVILPDGQINSIFIDDKKKTLLLDLDETLIHSCNPKEKPQVYVTASCDGEEAQIGINVRPYLEYFLSTLSNFYNIYLFTASSPPYASAICDYFDPESKYIIGMLTRGNCMETKNGFFIKDLRILKGKNMKDVILVDNLSHSFGFQLYNGVPILEWHKDTKDQELKYLVHYLVEASKVDDVREYNKEKLKLDELLTYQL